jgi:hypothetical protein
MDAVTKTDGGNMEIDQADSHTSSVTTTTTRRINLVKTPMLWDTHSEGKVTAGSWPPADYLQNCLLAELWEAYGSDTNYTVGDCRIIRLAPVYQRSETKK